MGDVRLAGGSVLWAAAVIPAALYLSLVLADRPFLAAPLALAVLVAFWASEKGMRGARPAAITLLVGVSLMVGAVLVSGTVDNAIDPPQWDFRWFWIHARVAALGGNFYEPEHARLIAGSFQNTPDFLPELVYFYPPPTMLLMAPLGWFDIRTASALWGAFHGVVLMVDIVLFWRVFLPDKGYLGLALAACMILLMRATWETVELAQTNFLVLLAVLLIWRDLRIRRAGLWLALGTAVKPLVAILGVYFLLRHRWPAVAVAVASGLVLVALSVAAFGPETVALYLRSNPVANAAEWQLTQTINQSLLATVLRAADGPLANVVFLTIAVAIIGVTAYVCSDRDAVSDELAMSLFIPAALMLYPSSLAHYGLLLVVPLGYLVSQRRIVPGGTMLVLGTALAVYALSGRFSFVAFVLVWTVMVAVGVIAIAKHRAAKGRPDSAGRGLVEATKSH